MNVAPCGGFTAGSRNLDGYFVLSPPVAITAVFHEENKDLLLNLSTRAPRHDLF